jgi:hypothetical protein
MKLPDYCVSASELNHLKFLGRTVGQPIAKGFYRLYLWAIGRV